MATMIKLILFFASLVAIDPVRSISDDNCVYVSGREQLNCASDQPTVADINKIPSSDQPHLQSITIEDIRKPLDLKLDGRLNWSSGLERLPSVTLRGLTISNVQKGYFANLVKHGIKSLRIEKITSNNDFMWHKDHFQGLGDTLHELILIDSGRFENDIFDALDNLQILVIKDNPNFLFFAPQFINRFNETESKFNNLTIKGTGFRGFLNWNPILDWYLQSAYRQGIQIDDSKLACDKRVMPILNKMRLPKNHFTYQHIPGVIGEIYCFAPDEVKGKNLWQVSQMPDFLPNSTIYSNKDLGSSELSVGPSDQPEVGTASVAGWVLLGVGLALLLIIALVFLLFFLKKNKRGNKYEATGTGPEPSVNA